jgi:hypothetical protein
MGKLFNTWVEAMGLKNSDIINGLPKDHVWAILFPPAGVSKETLKNFRSGKTKKLKKTARDALCKFTGMTKEELESDYVN